MVRELYAVLTAALTLTFTLPPSAIADDDAMDFSGLKWRNIGPAFMSGRISDIDWDPKDSSVWYVAVGSGGGLEDRKCRCIVDTHL